MRVLLISPNVEFLPDPVFPLGLAYIKAALKTNRIPCRILDLCFVADYEAAISSSITSFSPDIIGISLRNFDNVSYPNYTSYLPFYRRVVRTVRRESRAPVVLGGSGFSLMPQDMLENLGADYGIVGEAESSFIRLVNSLGGKTDIRNFPQPGIITGQSRIIEDLDEVPFPDRSDFNNEEYMRCGGMGNIQTKRGCPFKCLYCTYPVIEGKSIRLRSPGPVCDEIEDMLEYGIDNIFFVDNTFNYPMDHAREICREMLTRRLPVKWSCYANPRFISQELIELMMAAGCTGLEFGSDAANERMLVNLRKDFTVNDLRDASAICKNSGISFCHSLLLGGPGETMETVSETLDTMLDITPTAVICMVGIRIFPKTDLSITAMDEGIIGADQDFLKPVFYLSPAIEEDILPFIQEFSNNNPTWIFPGLKINMNEELQKKLRRFGVKGPLWEYMKMGARFGRG